MRWVIMSVSNLEKVEKQLFSDGLPSLPVSQNGSVPEPVWIWGLPLMPLTMEQSIAAIGKSITKAQPCYLITANLNYAMVSESDPLLQSINAQAAIILADGMPLVWASRFQNRRLPERVAGADLLFRVCERAASEGWRIFLVGGAEGVAADAKTALCERYPSLQIVGIEVPPFRALAADEEQAMLQRIRDAKPNLLLVAFGQPKGEIWIAKHYEELGVPVSIQVGASLDFAANRVRRAPRWVQRSGLEWFFRLAQEPRRLMMRYLRNAWFVVRMVVRSIFGRRSRHG